MNNRLIQSASTTYKNFPEKFWVLIGVTFIDHLGRSFLYPFFALYATQKFNASMTEVGAMFGVFAISSLFGNFIAGALFDKLGRKYMLIFGLIASALSSLLMGLVNQLPIFYVGAALVGLFGSSGEPAQQVMIADLLPEDKHTEGYSIWRVAFNLSQTIGPILGGLVAATSFLYLFIGDAIFSLITAGIVLWLLPETKPSIQDEAPVEDTTQTSSGYFHVIRDSIFMFYLAVSILLNVVDVQITSSLPVYLRDIHAVSPQHYGYILGLNAGMVVLFQLWTTRKFSSIPPLTTMALGALFYAVGYSLYGFVSWLPLFYLAMVIITIGEMIVTPISQTLIMRFAPIDMRGRYMAVFGSSWLIPFAAGPYLAGIIMDNYDPNWVWYLSGLISLVAASGYLLIHLKTKQKFSAPRAS